MAEVVQCCGYASSVFTGWEASIQFSLALCASMNSDLLSIIDLSQRAGPVLPATGSFWRGQQA